MCVHCYVLLCNYIHMVVLECSVNEVSVYKSHVSSLLSEFTVRAKKSIVVVNLVVQLVSQANSTSA